jgi:disulfide bond formation protein DsbB
VNKELALSSPPVGVAGASILGYSLPEWAAIVTIIYTIFLILRFVRNEWRLWRKGRE